MTNLTINYETDNVIENDALDLYGFKKLLKGVDKDRHYLKGVFIEPREKGYSMTASNGKILAHRVIEAELLGDFKPFILGFDVFKDLKKSTAKHEKMEIVPGRFAKLDGRIAVDYAVDGTYPEYRNLSQGEAGEVDGITFNPKLANNLYRALRLPGDGLTLQFVDKTSAIRVKGRTDEDYGLLMPVIEK